MKLNYKYKARSKYYNFTNVNENKKVELFTKLTNSKISYVIFPLQMIPYESRCPDPSVKTTQVKMKPLKQIIQLLSITQLSLCRKKVSVIQTENFTDCKRILSNIFKQKLSNIQTENFQSVKHNTFTCSVKYFNC